MELKQEAAFHVPLVEVLPVCLMMSSLVMSLIPALIGSDPMVQLHGGSVTRLSTCKAELLQRPLSTVPNVFVCFVMLASLRGCSGFFPRV